MYLLPHIPNFANVFQPICPSYSLAKRDETAYINSQIICKEVKKMNLREKGITNEYSLCIMWRKTVSKWFKEYPEKYTKEYIRAIQR